MSRLEENLVQLLASRKERFIIISAAQQSHKLAHTSVSLARSANAHAIYNSSSSIHRLNLLERVRGAQKSGETEIMWR
jgi:hypothetical protein